MDFRSTTDDLLDRLIVPSFTRLGPSIRRRLFDWEPIDLEGRRIAITGPTSGLGKAAALEMAAKGADLTLIARDPAKLEALVAELPGAPRTIVADMEDLASVDAAGRALADGPPIDALVHNAGALHNERAEVDGIERTLLGHVVAPFLMTARALPALRAGDDARIVTVSSGGMYSQGISLSDFNNERDYKGTIAYARAKRMQIVLGAEWACRLAGEVAVHAMHPGWADTPGVSDSLPGFGKIMGPLLRTPDDGADTILWLCAEPTSTIGANDFWLDRRPRPTVYVPNTATSPEKAATVWERVRDLAGLTEDDLPGN